MMLLSKHPWQLSFLRVHSPMRVCLVGLKYGPSDNLAAIGIVHSSFVINRLFES